MIVTIDGSAGSGKSTAARKLAARMQIAYLDTGAMYRAIAYAALRSGADFADGQALLDVAQSATLEVDCGPTHTRVRVNGEDVTEAIRSMAVNASTSVVAKHQGVRELLVEQQRSIGNALGAFVAEGRDQGSVVFPDADARFVLEASLDARARRRFQEMAADGEDVTLEQVRENLRKRDSVDQVQWASLLSPGAAIVLDTTNLCLREVVEMLVEHLRRLGLVEGEQVRGPDRS